jgi:hypothetical protein
MPDYKAGIEAVFKGVFKLVTEMLRLLREI